MFSASSDLCVPATQITQQHMILKDRIEQAEGAARLMKEKGFNFDLVYSSELKRAYQSAEVVLDILNDTSRSKSIEPMKVWELNERQ